MKLTEIAERCGWETVLLPDPDAGADTAYTSDLLSDVMAHCPAGAVLVTVQNHTNAVAVCTLVSAPAIAVAHGRPVPDDMLALARQERVALFRTPDDQFTASVKLGRIFSL